MQLTKIETITLYERWPQNLIYVLSIDKTFVPFLDGTWQKQTATNPCRSLTNDGIVVPEVQRLTAAQRIPTLTYFLAR